MSTDDRTETITDRAAIRDSADEREPERVCCDGGHANFPPLPDDPETTPEQRAGLDEVLAKVWPDPAPGATVAALDLDAIEGRARYALEWGDSANKEMILALVAEVRSLRAKVAAVEAKRDEFADLLARALPAVAALARVEAVADALTTAAKIERGHGLAYAGALIEAVQADIRAALATGEGK